MGKEIADFCEERKRCFDFKCFDMLGGVRCAVGVGSTGDGKEGGGLEGKGELEGLFGKEDPRPMNSLDSLHGFAHDTGDGSIDNIYDDDMMSTEGIYCQVNEDGVDDDDEGGDDGFFSHIRDPLDRTNRRDKRDKKERWEGNEGTSDELDHVLCLHDDDINPSEKTITALSTIGITMSEAVRIRRDTAINGSCTFNPDFSSAYLPSSITDKTNKISYKVTEKMKSYMTVKTKNVLILKHAADVLHEAGLKVGILHKLMIPREARMTKTLSWLIDLSQTNDGMVNLFFPLSFPSLFFSSFFSFSSFYLLYTFLCIAIFINSLFIVLIYQDYHFPYSTPLHSHFLFSFFLSFFSF